MVHVACRPDDGLRSWRCVAGTSRFQSRGRRVARVQWDVDCGWQPTGHWSRWRSPSFGCGLQRITDALRAVTTSAGIPAEAVVLNDSITGLVGWAVWTDAVGNQVYSELRGESAATGNRMFGTFLGGSGRYQGATGTYCFPGGSFWKVRTGLCKANRWASMARSNSCLFRSGPGGGASRP